MNESNEIKIFEGSDESVSRDTALAEVQRVIETGVFEEFDPTSEDFE